MSCRAVQHGIVGLGTDHALSRHSLVHLPRGYQAGGALCVVALVLFEAMPNVAEILLDHVSGQRVIEAPLLPKTHNHARV